MLASNLPRLLYIGDVAVESTVAGSALIYRLLQKYPADKLFIVEGNTSISQSEKRLSEIEYGVLEIGNTRLINSRFNRLYSSYLYLTAKNKAERLTEIIKTFKPEAILTVAHGYSWLTAAEIAKKYQLPLHFIVHDDLLSYIPMISQLKVRASQEFADVYRQAKSRFCVSPYMEEYYQHKYGVRGKVLYPSRAVDLLDLTTKLPLSNTKKSSLTIAYAGSINSQGYASALVKLASILEQINGRLIIYSPLSSQEIDNLKLNRSNVTANSLIPYQKLVEVLRSEADILYVPMSFEIQHKVNMQLSFPSKLTDYTAIGLSLLIRGPSYCSAIRWAKENPKVAEIVETEDVEALKIAIFNLQNLEYRRQLSVKAREIGREYFSGDRIVRQFYRSITDNMVVPEAIAS